MTISEDAVLVLAPPELDMRRPMQLLDEAGVTSHGCATVEELAMLAPRAGAALVCEKTLAHVDTTPLMRMLEGQPPWSDFPFLMVIDGDQDELDDNRVTPLETLGNVTFVEHPLQRLAFIGNVKTILAGRARQFRSRLQHQAMDESSRDQAAARERQRLLVRELHHRVKNTLATVQALMSSTARSSQTVEEFRQALLGRISALAHVHEVLTEDKWQEAPLRALFTFELEPLDGPDLKKRARLAGPDIKVPSHLAVPLGMAIHELTINAMRYGALSVERGTVDVSWEVETAAQAGMSLHIVWRERGGPPAPDKRRRGFGTQFLERVLHQQAAASVEIVYEPTGVKVEIRMPLPERAHFHLFADA